MMMMMMMILQKKTTNPQQINKPVSPDVQMQHPTKKRTVSWIETAANALNDLAKGATTEPVDEWEIFGKTWLATIRSTCQFALSTMCIYSARPNLLFSKVFSRYQSQPLHLLPNLCNMVKLMAKEVKCLTTRHCRVFTTEITESQISFTVKQFEAVILLCVELRILQRCVLIINNLS